VYNNGFDSTMSKYYTHKPLRKYMKVKFLSNGFLSLATLLSHGSKLGISYHLVSSLDSLFIKMRLINSFPLLVANIAYTVLAANHSYCPSPASTPWVRPSDYYGDIPGDVEELMIPPPVFIKMMDWNNQAVPYVPHTLSGRLRLKSVRQKIKHSSLLFGMVLDHFDSYMCARNTWDGKIQVPVLDYCGQPKCVSAGRRASFSIGMSKDNQEYLIHKDSIPPQKNLCFDISWYLNPNNDYLPNGPGVDGMLVSLNYCKV
jgi:hypothetical protein